MKSVSFLIHLQLRAIGGTSDQCIVKCHRKLGVRKVNEPTFSIIPVGVFMGEKLITCDKYTGAWTSCHFCQAACEQKHFSSAVILAMDLSNQCTMQKLIYTHTQKDAQPKLHPSTRWQNMTAHKKCKVHKLWHWRHAVSRVKHCTLAAIMPPLSWGGAAMRSDRQVLLLSPLLTTTLYPPSILTQAGFDAHEYLYVFFFFFLRSAARCSKMVMK